MSVGVWLSAVISAKDICNQRVCYFKISSLSFKTLALPFQWSELYHFNQHILCGRIRHLSVMLELTHHVFCIKFKDHQCKTISISLIEAVMRPLIGIIIIIG